MNAMPLPQHPGYLIDSGGNGVGRVRVVATVVGRVVTTIVGCIVTGLFWPAFMALILLYVVRTRGRWRAQGDGVSLLLLAMLYAASMASVFEGANRHHYAFAVLLTSLAAAALRPDANLPWSVNRNGDGRQPL